MTPPTWRGSSTWSSTARRPEGLLDTYQAERLPSARAAIDFSIELGKVICVPDPAEAAARDEAMAAGVGDEPLPAPGLPGIDTGLVHPKAAHAGNQLPQGRAGGQWFDDTHTGAARVITESAIPDGTALGAAARDWFASIGGRVIPAGGDPGLDRWFAEHRTSWAVQRPDFYLYGTAASAADATGLLADLRAHLAGGPYS